MRSTHVTILAGLLLAALPAALNAQTWSRYANPRFGTTAEYPAGKLRAERAPDNGDGQSFVGRDGARLAIFGAYNVNNAGPPEYEKFLRDSGGDSYAAVTYRASGADWLVLSGARGSQIFYEKYLFRDHVVHGLVVTYPLSLKASYDPIVARIARSLAAGDNAR